ncbi:MAG: 23S rRNA (adenine(2030)-N(6))-methyltransferase RlmJ [Gammaproteobacteria bacterium]|nr:23S rRNA (adenine(2030)-N(6))-methyltransferase RlmJ [Gammaproteobacteria bacterium]
MNYRHSYHSGNVADVFKHVVLIEVLRALRQKDAPFCVVDTHAGAGVYVLKEPGEFGQGIGVVWPERGEWPALADYFALVGKFNKQAPDQVRGGGIKYYPGSPFIIGGMLRGQDRAVLIERQDEEYQYLKHNLSGVKNAAAHHADAWSALKGFIPPREKRGLLFIDPPYESPDEFGHVLAALEYAARHWSNGVMMAWYPVKSRFAVRRFHAGVRDLRIKAEALEFLTLPDDVENRLNGSGIVIVNSPWKLMDSLKEMLPPLAARLAGEGGRPEVRVIDLQ